MQPSLILVLLIELGLCALAYYLGFVVPARSLRLRHLPQTAFIVLGLLSIFVAWVLYQQSLAEYRLRAAGITPHPKLSHAIGYANGRGENPVWLFKASSLPEPVLEFYRDATHYRDWTVVSDSALLLILENKKEKRRLSIGAVEEGSGASVSFLSYRHPSITTLPFSANAQVSVAHRTQTL